MYKGEWKEGRKSGLGELVIDDKGDSVITATGPNPDRESYTVTLKPGAGTWTSLGVEGQSDARPAPTPMFLSIRSIEGAFGGDPQKER